MFCTRCRPSTALTWTHIVSLERAGFLCFQSNFKASDSHGLYASVVPTGCSCVGPHPLGSRLPVLLMPMTPQARGPALTLCWPLSLPSSLGRERAACYLGLELAGDIWT